MASLGAGMAGCSSTPKGDDAVHDKLALQEKVDAKLTDADAAFKAGNVDQGMAALDDAIKLDPSAKQPWLKKAQYHFEKHQYGVAITESEEALQRDVNDNTARSILAVSGLRVSADALEQLRKANEVTGSARNEAESVARIIREALGEPILVPAPAASASEPAKPVVRAARAAPRSAAAAAGAAAAGTSSLSQTAPAKARPVASSGQPAGNGRSNPFGALQ